MPVEANTTRERRIVLGLFDTTDSSTEEVDGKKKYRLVHNLIEKSLENVYGAENVQVISEYIASGNSEMEVYVDMGDIQLTSEQSNGASITLGGLIAKMTFLSGCFDSFGLGRLKLDLVELGWAHIHPHCGSGINDQLYRTYIDTKIAKKEKGKEILFMQGEVTHNVSFRGMCTGTNSPLNLHQFDINEKARISPEKMTEEDYEFFFHQFNATIAKESSLDPPKRTINLKNKVIKKIEESIDAILKGYGDDEHDFIDFDKDVKACIKRLEGYDIIKGSVITVNINNNRIIEMLKDAADKGEINIKESTLSKIIVADLENEKWITSRGEVKFSDVVDEKPVRVPSDIIIKGKRRYIQIQKGFQFLNNIEEYSNSIMSENYFDVVRLNINNSINFILPILTNEYVKSEILRGKMAAGGTKTINHSYRSGRSRLLVGPAISENGPGFNDYIRRRQSG